MNDLAIRVTNINKRYQLGSIRHDTLRDLVASSIRYMTKGNTNDSKVNDELLALDDVTFDVRQGEVVGIIGRNGAGKSTLLKILSQITEPTSGRVEIYGRVGSLLEVGTGFHPELTGRENIYLNGAILGMGHHEIKRKFDEIVAFAEVDKFLDTPVKRYSSGMYVRLAFAVAAHLEPEVLLVDEVLAVGDVAFQRKCMGKMTEVAGQGRTIFFVSHSMAAIQALCTRAIFLRYGKVWMDDNPTNVVRTYLETLEESASQQLAERVERRGKGEVRLTKLELVNGEDSHSSLVAGQPAKFIFHLSALKPGIGCGFTIYNHYGQSVVNFATNRTSIEDQSDRNLGSKIVCELDELLLVPGRYRIDTDIRSNYTELEDHVEAAAIFDVAPGQLRGRPVAETNTWGSTCMYHRWRLPQ